MSIRLSSRLLKVTRNNEFIEDITSLVLQNQGRVSFDPDRAIKWDFTASVLDDGSLTPFVDFIAPYLTVEYEDGTTIESQMGVYTTVPPRQSVSQSGKKISLDCRDLTWILDNDVFPNGYTFSSGGNIVSQVATLLSGYRVAIPASATVLPATTSWGAGTSRLRVVNDLLVMAGYYTLTMDKTGQLVSMPYVADKDKAESRSYDSNPRSRVRVLRTIERDTTPERIANLVVVIGGATTDTPIVATKRNTSPASPTSYPSIGYWISKKVEGAQVADQAAADAMAQRYLDTASQQYHRLTLYTTLDLEIDPYDVYRLNITDARGAVVADGIWNSRGWSIDIPSRVMTHTMSNIDTPPNDMAGGS